MSEKPLERIHESLSSQVIGAGLWALGLSWGLPMMSGLNLLQKRFPADRLDRLNRLYTRVQIALTGSRWRSVVHPDIDPKGVYLFAQNHTNHFDHVALYPATPHFKQGIELEEHFRYPVYGPFMKSRGTIAVRRGSRSAFEEMRRAMVAEVARGHSLLVFPEGTRTLDGRVGPFRRGVFHIARELGVPIVPVAVTGSFEMMRKGSWVIHPGHTITVYCEKPIPTAGMSKAEIPALMEQVRSVIAARVDAYFERKSALAR